MSFPTVEHNSTSSQWEGLNDFFSQSMGVTDNFNFLDVDWPRFNQDEEFGKGVQPLPSAMGNLFDQYDSTLEPLSSLKEFSEVSMSPISDAELHEARQNPAKRMKGRPKVGTEGNRQPAIERRRAQVRQAQQAYRQRKEAMMVSIKTESEELRTRIRTLEGGFDELLKLVREISLTPIQTDHVKRLTALVDEGRTLIEEDDAKNKQKPNGPMKLEKRRKSDDGRFNQGKFSNILPADLTLASRGVDMSSSGEIGDHTIQGTNVLESLDSVGIAKPLASVRTPENPWANQTAFRPFIAKTLEPSLSISVRFRHGALRRGYQMLTTHEASYSMICRTFRYNIFSNARETLIDRLFVLLNESMATLPYLGSSSGDSLSYEVPSNSKPIETVAPFSNIVYRLPQRVTQTEATSPSGAKAITEESPEEYLYADGVEDYLVERGLSVEPGSDVVLFPAPTSASHTSNPTLFDELRAEKQLRLSVSKLLGELLNRVVCLEMGPGIRPSEIDESIRSTVIAAIR